MCVRVLSCLKLPVDSSVSLERLGGAVAAFHSSLLCAYITGLWVTCLRQAACRIRSWGMR